MCEMDRAAQVVRFWRAVEMFSPQDVPKLKPSRPEDVLPDPGRPSIMCANWSQRPKAQEAFSIISSTTPLSGCSALTMIAPWLAMRSSIASFQPSISFKSSGCLP